jgi:hypothetical protein
MGGGRLIKRRLAAISGAPAWARTASSHIEPNRFLQSRTVSWQMPIPRSNNKSSTFPSESGYRTYIMTASRIASG